MAEYLEQLIKNLPQRKKARKQSIEQYTQPIDPLQSADAADKASGINVSEEGGGSPPQMLEEGNLLGATTQGGDSPFMTASGSNASQQPMADASCPGGVCPPSRPAVKTGGATASAAAPTTVAAAPKPENLNDPASLLSYAQFLRDKSNSMRAAGQPGQAAMYQDEARAYEAYAVNAQRREDYLAANAVDIEARDKLAEQMQPALMGRLYAEIGRLNAEAQSFAATAAEKNALAQQVQDLTYSGLAANTADLSKRLARGEMDAATAETLLTQMLYEYGSRPMPEGEQAATRADTIYNSVAANAKRTVASVVALSNILALDDNRARAARGEGMDTDTRMQIIERIAGQYYSGFKKAEYSLEDMIGEVRTVLEPAVRGAFRTRNLKNSSAPDESVANSLAQEETMQIISGIEGLITEQHAIDSGKSRTWGELFLGRDDSKPADSNETLPEPVVPMGAAKQ